MFDMSKEFLEEMEKFHKYNMMGKIDTAPIVYLKRGKEVGICPIISDGEPHSPMDHLKEIIYETKPDAYLFASEAWMAMEKKGSSKTKDLLKKYKYGDIEKLKTKQEVLIMTGSTMDKKHQVHKVFKMKRNKAGEVTKLTEQKKISGFKSHKEP